jgi:mRNA-degrading endonuclease RelE of RelBE toxin-antitoxin system
MYRIAVRPQAARQIRRLRRVDAVAILDALETYLQYEPERVSRSRIKRLRGDQRSTYRLRVGEYRVFYDVTEGQVMVNAVLHKRDTATYYGEEQ